MRVAFVGKGGAGKSAVAGTFARLLARRDADVLVLDSDPMPGVAFSVGVASSDAGIPDDAVEENPGDEGPRFRLRSGLSAGEAVERYAAVGPDGVRVLQFGKLRGHVRELVASQAAYHQIVDQLPAERWSLVGDLPAGTRQPFFGWGRFARTVLVVVEPTASSLLSARRLARLGLAAGRPHVVAVANKVAEADDVERVARATGLQVVAAIPRDPAVAEADRLGRAPLDHDEGSPAVVAIASLVDRLQAEEEPS